MEKKIRFTRKSSALIVVSLLILLLFTINVTFAFFTASVSTTTGQSLTFDTLVLSVTDENNWDVKTGSRETTTTIIPGTEIDMAGIITLTGTPAYLKVAFNVIATGAGGNQLDNVATDAIKTALGEALNAQTASTNKWFQNSTDKAWYCVVPNSAGDVIDFSLGSVTIPLATTGNVWQGASIAISYTVSAVQSEHVTIEGQTDEAKAVNLKAFFDTINIDTGIQTT